MRVLVTGGRDYNDYETVRTVLSGLDRQPPISVLIHGGAPGAGRWAEGWAAKTSTPTRAAPADWLAHGKAAGPIRNRQMLLLNPELVVAFPGGKGTSDMVSAALKAKVKILQVG